MIDRDTLNLETKEMRRLYFDEGLSLRRVAKRFGITFQAVHLRFRGAGIPLRPRCGPPPRRIEKEGLERLYLTECLSISKIAEVLRITTYSVGLELDRHGIERRKQGSWRSKYYALNLLNIGDSIQVDRPNGVNPYVSLYIAAAYRGIRLSVKSVGTEVMEVTRKG